ncbi:hypothetical protein MGMO_54c00060 [Methyloglobulus morosus KoM1]|uniref:Uncharacterized protein n=1 Tax=Methyloglobulus morosus KoM1 TaxID=1116472 RepID=V5C226_9GAMM|nr:hypothetical protein MGMO_54c00060 [Methyloglobulus morosus KoM1]
MLPVQFLIMGLTIGLTATIIGAAMTAVGMASNRKALVGTFQP